MRNLKNLNVTTVMALSLILTTGVSSLNSVSESGIINTAFAAEVLKSDVKVKVTTKGGTLNLRKQPSNGAVVASLENGTELITMQDAGPSWVKVKVLEGKHTGMEGWVSLNYIDNGKYTETVGTDINGEVYKYVTTEKHNLNVRKLADSNSEKIGELTRGAKIRVYGETPRWYKVRITVKGQAVYGWANKTYLTDKKPNENDSNGGSNNSTEQLVPIKTMYVDTKDDNLNVRASKSASATKIGELTKGAKINIYKEEDGWYKVTVNGKYGWAKASFFSATDPKTQNSGDKGTPVTNSNSNGGSTKITNETGRAQMLITMFGTEKAGSGTKTQQFRNGFVYEYSQKAVIGDKTYYKLKAIDCNRTGWVQLGNCKVVTKRTNISSSQATVRPAQRTKLYKNVSCTNPSISVSKDQTLYVEKIYKTAILVNTQSNKKGDRGYINKGLLKMTNDGLSRNSNNNPKNLIVDELLDVLKTESLQDVEDIERVEMSVTPVSSPILAEINLSEDEETPYYVYQYVVDVKSDESEDIQTLRFDSKDVDVLKVMSNKEKVRVEVEKDGEDMAGRIVNVDSNSSNEKFEIIKKLAKDYVDVAKSRGVEIEYFTEEELKDLVER